MRASLLRSLPHHAEVMLCMLVIVLGFDCVAGQGSGTRQRHVPLVLRFCIDALIGPPPVGARGGSVRAGRESSGAIALVSCHESGGGFSTVAPSVRAKIRAHPMRANLDVWVWVWSRGRASVASPPRSAKPQWTCTGGRCAHRPIHSEKATCRRDTAWSWDRGRARTLASCGRRPSH